MIRYPVSPEDLRIRIEAESPGWLAEAEERTDRFRQAGRYEEISPNWSRIKPVYIRLQHGKCAYCERRLAAEDFGGAIEHDLEHYRPKGAVPAWPSADIARDRRISYRFATGEAFPEGYYLLAYHVLNYATACKKCNSPLKASYFPIAGERVQGDEPAQLKAEWPFLLFPLGDLDEDPEEVLTFVGVNPVPKARRGIRRQRARITIDFFELDQREELRRERTEKIVALFIALEMAQSGSEQNRELAGRAVEMLLYSASAHANCVRAFHARYREDRDLAAEIARTAQSYLDSQS